MAGVFRPQRHDGRCPGGRASATRSSPPARSGRTEVLQLPDRRPGAPGDPLPRHRRRRARPGLHPASRHGQGPKGKRELDQLAAAARALNGRAARRAVIVGGDFNPVPGQMGALIDPARAAVLRHRPAAGAGTRGRKIDYVLFSRGHFANPSGGPQASKFSDHEALVGQATRHDTAVHRPRGR